MRARSGAGSTVLSFGAGRVVVDLAIGQAREGTRTIPIGARALDLLQALVRQAPQVVSNAALLQAAWPEQPVDPNNLQVQVRALRRLLGDDAIATVRGRGYRLVRLPDPPASDGFIGREALLAAAVDQIGKQGVRLLVLTGPAGVGKTRLAKALQAAMAGQYPDGSAFVALETQHHPERLAEVLVRAIGLRPLPEAEPEAVLAMHLRSHRMLLVLDNLEQLAADLKLLPRLLQAAPMLALVLTSRVRLDLPGESVIAVPPLAVPVAHDDLRTMLRAPALRLLMLRAQAEAGSAWPPALLAWADIVPDGAAAEALAPDAHTRAELDALAEICRRVDGLPLALELAAARLRPMSARALLARMDQPLELLGQGADTPPARQRSLRDTLAWSTGLLTEGARRLFEALSVFADGCTLEAAVAVAGDGAGLTATLDRIDALLAHHLLRRDDGDDGEPRYRMLQMVHEFAQAQLKARGDWPPLQQRHAAHFTSMAEDLQPRWSGVGRAEARRRLDAEAANLDAALNWYVHVAADTVGAMRLVAALTWWWYFAGRLIEGRRWQDAALALPDADRHPALRARVLVGAGKLSLYLMQMPQATALSAQAASLAAEAGDNEARAWALHQQAIPLSGPQPERSVALHDEAERLFGVIGERWGAALARVYSGIAPSLIAGREAEAAHRLGEGQRQLKAMGDEWGASVADHYLGVMALRSGDFDSARRCAAEALRVAEVLGDGFRIATGRHQLARIAAAAGRWDEAAQRLRDSAQLHHAQGRGGYANAVLRELAVLAWRRGDARRAARLFGAAEVDRGPMSPQLVPPRDAQAAQEARAALAADLGPKTWERLRAEGGRLKFEQALALAVG